MNTKQIAEEAAKQIARKLKHANVTSLWIEDIIQAAIEKARKLDLECITTRTRERDAYRCRLDELESRAARAGEPWTVQPAVSGGLGSLFGSGGCLIATGSAQMLEAIADAHNATPQPARSSELPANPDKDHPERPAPARETS